MYLQIEVKCIYILHSRAMTDVAITYIHKLYMQIWRNERILLGGGEWGCHKKLGAGYVLAVQDMSVAELQLQ